MKGTIWTQKKMKPPEHLCPVVLKAEPDKASLFGFKAA